MTRVMFLFSVIWVSFITLFMAMFVFLIIATDVYALGGENGQPEVNLFGGIASDGVLVAVGIIDPNPFSDDFIPLEEITGTVHVNELWFALYVPKSVDKDELEFQVEYWKERDRRSVRELPDGSKETITYVEKYDESTEVLSVPVQNNLYLVSEGIENHKNLTHVKIKYQDFEWEFTHQSTPATKPVDWVNNLGDVWFLYLVASVTTMFTALGSFAVGKWIFEKVKYVPPLDMREILILMFFLTMFVGASYGWLEYRAMNYEWYIMQLPIAGIITFLSLQYYSADKRRVLGIRIPPQNDGSPDIEVATYYPLVVRDRKSDFESEDILVHRWSWRNVIYRLITGGPTVVYDSNQKFHTRDISGNFEEVYFLHPEHPPLFKYPHLKIAWHKLGPLPVPYPCIERGIAVMYLAPQYEIDKIHVMSDINVIGDNNDAREKAEKKLYDTVVKIQSKSAEKAFAFLDVVTKELFGEQKEESEEEKPEEEPVLQEPEEVVDAILKEKKGEEDSK